MIRFLKDYTMPIAIFLGVAGYKIFSELNFVTPFLIFIMLFLTFSKMNFENLKPSWLHFWLLAVEVGLSVIVFYLLKPIDINLAQGAMICVLCPTATAAAVITKKLNGQAEFVASYTLYANLTVAIVAPILFPLTKQNLDVSFIELFVKIFSKIFPLVICPLFLAIIVRKFQKINFLITKYSDLAFYIWALSLVIVISDIAYYFMENNHISKVTVYLGVASFVLCFGQFFIGKILGQKTGNSVASGQSLGQKNTVLAMWLANSYFNPLVAVGAGTYVIWQNIFNSVQIYLANKNR